MNVLYFSQCKSLDDVEKTYKEIYKLFGLKGEPENHFIKRVVDEEYKHISKSFQIREKVKDEDSVNEFSLEEILEEILDLKLSSEVCGKWLWLSDRNAYKHRDHLKQLGFRFSKAKKCFYWRPSDCRSDNQDPMPMEYIRGKYGSETIPVEA